MDDRCVIGKVFPLDGRVAGMIGPKGMELPADPPAKATFEILRITEATASTPAWTDLLVNGDIRMRVNPEIASHPFLRLFDAVAVVSQHFDRIPHQPEVAVIALAGKKYSFFRAMLPDGEVLLVDTHERLLKWRKPQHNDGLLRDGSWRIA